MVKLCLVTQEVWGDIPLVRINFLNPFLSWTWRVGHEANGLSQPLLILLHLTVWCTGQNAIINFCLVVDNSRQVADLTRTKNVFGQFLQLLNFPLKFMCVSFLFSIYFLLMMLFLTCSSSSWCCSVLPISRRHFSLINSQKTVIACPPIRERYGCLSWVPSVTEVSPSELFC